MSVNGHNDNAPNTVVVKKVSAYDSDALPRFVSSIQAGTPLTTGVRTSSAERMPFGALASAELPPINATMAFRNEPAKETPAVASAELDHGFLGVDTTLPNLLSGKNTRGIV